MKVPSTAGAVCMPNRYRVEATGLERGYAPRCPVANTWKRLDSTSSLLLH